MNGAHLVPKASIPNVSAPMEDHLMVTIAYVVHRIRRGPMEIALVKKILYMTKRKTRAMAVQLTGNGYSSEY